MSTGNSDHLGIVIKKFTKFPVSKPQSVKKLQVLQNSVNRLITGARQGTATTDLLDNTNSLSVQQMVAYYTLIMVHKITLTGKPDYLAKRLSLRQENAREL